MAVEPRVTDDDDDDDDNDDSDVWNISNSLQSLAC